MTYEIILTLCIAIIAFHPKKWPMIAYHMARALRFIKLYKERAIAFFQQQVDLYQLEENKKKASKADQEYET
jgi:Sec-independent protein translocase protein TatA